MTYNVFRFSAVGNSQAAQRLQNMAAEEVQGVPKIGLVKKKSKLIPLAVKTGCSEVPRSPI